ncbi:hypothetical protein OH492_18355 [Vibrio chagasii]|nr:hypothetical protein [Vibrio chagasii]
MAETSLPFRIKYVIDPGTARISRYSHRTIQRLPIEPISQASANQRKGRCVVLLKVSVFACTQRRFRVTPRVYRS